MLRAIKYFPRSTAQRCTDPIFQSRLLLNCTSRSSSGVFYHLSARNERVIRLHNRAYSEFRGFRQKLTNNSHPTSPYPHPNERVGNPTEKDGFSMPQSGGAPTRHYKVGIVRPPGYRSSRTDSPSTKTLPPLSPGEGSSLSNRAPERTTHFGTSSPEPSRSFPRLANTNTLEDPKAQGNGAFEIQTGEAENDLASVRGHYSPGEPELDRDARGQSSRFRERADGTRHEKWYAGSKKSKDHRQFDDEESAILETEKPAKSGKKTRRKNKSANSRAPQGPLPLSLPSFISVEKLASLVNVRMDVFMKRLNQFGFDNISHDYVLNDEMSGLIAGEFGFEPIIDRTDDMDIKPRPPAVDKSALPHRPPVVTIMGHVDHGKTTLLDWLRKSSTVSSEHGGITQHIGAFSVSMPSGKIITFLDTPGHAAFLSMRERGASVTDIVILVVAADDSVKPQTIEAIKHAQNANVPMIIAISKIDKGDANIEKVKEDLMKYGVELEEYGGDTQVVCISAKSGAGMQELEEATVTLGEILDHRAEDDGQCEGWILEATTRRKGQIATVLVTRGTLRQGGILVAGRAWAKVRSLADEKGHEVSFARPGTPVEVDGWRSRPAAGDAVLQVETEEQAKSAVEVRMLKYHRIQQARDMDAINQARRNAKEREDIAARGRAEDPASSRTGQESLKANTGPEEITFIIKADVCGSAEAITASIVDLGNDEVRSKIIRSDFGAVTEFDVDQAAAAKAYILAFNLPTDPQIFQYALAKGVTILSHKVIYQVVKDVTEKLSDKLAPSVTRQVTGEAEVMKIFTINVRARTYKSVAGCRVKNGVVSLYGNVRVLRNNAVVYDGGLKSLKDAQKDATEIRRGNECGIGFESWEDFQVGDQIQCYRNIETKRTLPVT